MTGVCVIRLGESILIERHFGENGIDKVLIISAPFLCLGFVNRIEETSKVISIVSFMKHIGKEIVKTDKNEQDWSED